MMFERPSNKQSLTLSLFFSEDVHNGKRNISLCTGSRDLIILDGTEMADPELHTMWGPE